MPPRTNLISKFKPVVRPFHTASMAARRAPAEPLVVVLGSTGTGKSELAIELAKLFRGEVINADAMQLYNGLPIITNKVTVEEQRGVAHHLLGHIPLDHAPWDVDEYKSEATRVMGEIRARGNLPILVGGTHYYVDALLFQDVILDNVHADANQSFPLLEEPTDVLLEELSKVDPIMAERWHPNDRRKIRRSLEIYLQTGRPASELYAEQAARKAAARDAAGEQPWQKLLFWVHSEREALCERLDRRVDKMLAAGLLEEIRELTQFKRRSAAAGRELDMSKGIWQSIGYKQFEPCVMNDAGVEEMKTAIEETKTATRRYANYQTKWIRLKQIPRLEEQGTQALDSLYVLDSTDAAKFQTHVVEPAASVTAKFLNGEDVPAPTEMSEVARDVLATVGRTRARETPCQKRCEACRTTCVTEEGWERHVKSAGHAKVMRRKRRRALVVVDGE